MSGPHAAVADAVMSSIEGGREAQRLVYRLRQGCALPDELFDALGAILAVADSVQLRGFARELQKALEAAR